MESGAKVIVKFDKIKEKWDFCVKMYYKRRMV